MKPVSVSFDPGKLVSKGLLVFSLFLSSLSSFAVLSDGGDAAKGKDLFNANCASCHRVTEEPLAAPGLKGVEDRWKGKEALIVKWIQNPTAALASGDAYITGMVEKYKANFGMMQPQAVSDTDIKDILAYVKTGGTTTTPDPNQPVGPQCETVEDVMAKADAGKESGTATWFIILGVVLAIIAVSAANISKSLRNAMREQQGLHAEEHHSYWHVAKGWMWKHKVFVSLIGLFAFCYISVVGYQVLMDIGVYSVGAGYAPEQPIKFSHAIHVCENNIDCQYCHSSASKSRHAGIPSANVCMNCHKGIKEGPRYGKVEIQKIYDAIGFDPATGSYKAGYAEQPIEWVKVHALPDHVAFNHQTHVSIAGIDCKQCHGPVQTFTVGRQSPVEWNNAQTDVEGLVQLTKPTLTMGWCLECHQKSKVDLAKNEYYEEMHKRYEDSELGRSTLRRYLEQNRKRGDDADKVGSDKTELTVQQLGGWECGKCHY